MTQADQIAKIGFIGDGVTKIFAFPFPFAKNADIKIFELDVPTGVETERTTGFVTTGEGTGSGTVTYTVAPPIDTNPTLVRIVLFDQEADYRKNEGFPSEEHEEQMDEQVRMMQELREQVARAIVVPFSTNPAFSGATGTLPVAKKGLRISDNGLGFDFTIVDLEDVAIATTASAASAAAALVSENAAAVSAAAAAVSETNAAASAAAHGVFVTDLATIDTVGKGANLVGVEDVNSRFIGTTQEDVNNELFVKAAGPQNAGISAVVTTAHSTGAGTFTVAHNLPGSVVPAEIRVHANVYDGTTGHMTPGSCTIKSGVFSQCCAGGVVGNGVPVAGKVTSYSASAGAITWELEITAVDDNLITFTITKDGAPAGQTAIVCHSTG